MANPLTLYVPIKQDPATQAAAQLAYKTFVKGVKGGLDDANIVHYARLALIPNPNGQGTLAILLITTFDGPMDPYLQFFWKDKGTRTAFAGVALLALNPPVPPVTEINGFEKFINANNLNVPADLYQAYTLTVKQIKHVPKSTTASPA